MMLYKPGGGVDRLFDEIRADCFQAMERVGDQVADEWRERLAVPVEYVTGPRGGITVIRSAPGESPRRETGNLQDSVLTLTESDADLIITTIGSDIPYALYLEAGTARVAPRPHAPDLDDFAARMVNAIGDAIAGG